MRFYNQGFYIRILIIMKLLIISPTPHYKDKTWTIKGHGPTVKEIDYLGSLFKNIVHIAPMYHGTPPDSFLPYNKDNIKFIPIKPAGGNSLKEKLEIFTRIPHWIDVIEHVLKSEEFDLIHIRVPSSFSLVTLSYFKSRRIEILKWIKFAGNWETNSTESLATKIQKRILKAGIYRSFVTLNYLQNLPNKNFVPFPNPSFSLHQYLLNGKIVKEKQLTFPVNIAYIGNLYRTKGIMESLAVVRKLIKSGYDIVFHIAGSGHMEKEAKEFVKNNNMQKHVVFYGSVSHEKVFKILEHSHFLLFPTYFNEGWPKVLSEAMSMGTIPITGNVSIIPDIIKFCRCGYSAPANRTDEFASIITQYIKKTDGWKMASSNAYRYAAFFTYEYYGLKLVKTLNLFGAGKINTNEQQFENIRKITGQTEFIL